MRVTLLFLHVVAAASWFGANVTQGVVTPLFVRAGGESAARWWRATVEMGRRLYMPAGIIVLVTGILLVTTQAAYSFADTFVSIGLLAVIVGVVLGIAAFAPRGRRAAELHERGDSAAAVPVERSLAGFGAFDTVVLGVAILAMVSKW